MGSLMSSEEVPAEEQQEPVVERTITLKTIGINGDEVLEPQVLEKSKAVKLLRRALLDLKKHDLPQEVAILRDGEELNDGHVFADEDEEMEVSIVFKTLQLTDEKRKQLEKKLKDNNPIMVCIDFKGFPPVAKADRELVQVAVRCYPDCLKHVHEALRNDRDFMAEVVKRVCQAYQFLPDEIKADREIARSAINGDYTMFRWACDSIREDKEIALIAVNADGMLLKYAGESLKNDKDVVKEAVARSRDALQFASAALQADEEVLAAQKPEREKTELEKAMEEGERIREQERFHTQPQNTYSSVEWRPVTLQDRIQIDIYNQSGNGMRFSNGLSGW